MIATIEQHTPCKVCGTPIVQKGGKGHRKRIYCGARCKQIDYRRTHHSVTIGVTLENEKYTAELERENKDLQERLNQIASVDELYRTDTKPYQFQKWLGQQPAHRKSEFVKHLLSDRVPTLASRAEYQQWLSSLKYSEEERAVFVDVWKEMLTAELIKMNQ